MAKPEINFFEVKGHSATSDEHPQVKILPAPESDSQVPPFTDSGLVVSGIGIDRDGTLVIFVAKK